jgi:hypothetical protein
MSATHHHRRVAFLCFWTTFALACAGPGFVVPAEASNRSGAQSLEVTDAHGNALRTFDRGGRTYVLGEEGQRYRIRVHNRSPETVEAVISVDGRDVLDGQIARSDKPGYLIAPWGDVLVDGFRLSLRDVATFRFSPVAASYAAQMGSDRHVGVIGVAIFRPRPLPPPRPQPVQRYPNSPPCDGPSARAGDDEKRQSAPAESAASGKGAVAERQESRPGLGTAFGERRTSQVTQATFERANPMRPDALLAVNYNDKDGLLALGIDIRPPRPRPDWRELHRRETAQPFTDVPRDFAAPPPGWSDR